MIMEEKINVAELLKDCPKGMELDCTIFDGVKFMEADTESDTIILRVGNKFIRRLNKYGKNDNIDCAKCVIFPKGKNTWEGFVPPCKFKNGDIVVDDSGAIFLYRQIHPYYVEPYADFYCGVTSELGGFVIKTDEAQRCSEISSIRYATEEEKQILFDAIKERGYCWNSETKTLEKLITPKFKVGDRIRKENNNSRVYTINGVYSSMYGVEGRDFWILIEEQDEWELVPNKFDINTLKPFDKVLVRDEILLEDSEITDATWSAALYSHNKFGDNACPYVTTNGHFAQCVPYKNNEHLLGTTDDCDEYYKTWE